MEQTYASTNYGGNAPQNYQRFFVPDIGEPCARDLVAAAALKKGEHVLDVACGTGVVARLAAREVGREGSVTGVDLNPGMIAAAKASTDPDLGIDYIEAGADEIPLRDGRFDVVFCQMSLQFIQAKLAALREMRRVLKPSGRVALNVPGPKPPLFEAMAGSVARHLSEEGGTFLDLVFSLHEPDELRDLFGSAGFREIEVTRAQKALIVAPPREFLWQYIHSTPLAGLAESADEAVRDALEAEVCSKWSDHAEDERIRFEVGMTTVRARA